MEPFVPRSTQAGGPLHRMKSRGVITRDYIAGKRLFSLQGVDDRLRPWLF